LGHGILPKTNPENVKRLVEFVRSYNLWVLIWIK
jgi:uroporphyrinogen-III decarboxylase